MTADKKLQVRRLYLDHITSLQTYFRAIVENDVTEDDIKNPAFWSLVSSRFERAGDMCEIEIFPDDKSWYMRAKVADFGKTHAVVTPYSFVQIQPVSKIEEHGDGYRVEWGGAHEKHRVLDKENNVVKSGIIKRKDADDFLDNHRKAMAR